MKLKKKITQFGPVLFLFFFLKHTDAQNNKKDDLRKSGFFMLYEMPVNIGTGKVTIAGQEYENADMGFGFRIITGIQEHRNIYLGLGIGTDKYQDVTFVPLTVDLRIPFSNKPVSLMLILNTGYSFGIGDVKGGVIIDPALGLKMDFPKSSTSCFFSVGYKWQESEIQYTYTNKRGAIYPMYSSDVIMQFLTFSTGVCF